MASPQQDPGAASHLTLLAVGGEEKGLEEVLHAYLPALALTHVATLSEAAALLRKIRYDLLLVEHQLEDGTSFDVLEEVADLDVYVPVVVRLPEEAQEEALEVLRAGAQDVLLGEGQVLPVTLLEALRRHQQDRQRERRICEEQRRQLLQSVRDLVVEVSHEINNPLAIISGNAQLLVELADALELDEAIRQPIGDIEEATGRLAASLRKLNDLKEDLRVSAAAAPPEEEGGTHTAAAP